LKAEGQLGAKVGDGKGSLDRGGVGVESNIKARMRWIAVFAALLLACSAAPVLADSPDPAPEESTSQFPDGDDPERYFDGHVVVPDLAEVERDEREREEWLASPEAVQQREASWLAYGDLSAGESEELLRSVFAEQLQALNDDPARFLSDAQLVRPLDETAAAVKDEGERSLLDASIPLRTEDEDGDLAKLDLSLTQTPQGYETANSLSDLRLPLAADEKAEVGDQGFAISQAQAEDSGARRFGDKNLLYHEVLPATDLMVAPTATGVELFNLLRSKESPEVLRFDLDLPEGAELRTDGYKGAEVTRDGKTLTHIAPPLATDAQGTSVPVELEVEQSAIVLHVAHRDGDFAAPILVDPIVEDWANTGANWYEGKNLGALTNGAWVFKSNNSTFYHDVWGWGGSKFGLITATAKNTFYGPNQNGQWSYSTANSKTYIQHAWVTPFWRYDESCNSAQPHDYAGMLWEPGEIWNPVVANAAKNANTLSTDGNGQAFIIGLGTGPPGVWISCARHLYAGGVALWINDDWPPVIHSITGPPAGWFGDQEQTTFTVDAGDEGLGIYKIKLTPAGTLPIEAPAGCTGLYGARCPNEKVTPIKVSGNSFAEGIRTMGVIAEDPSGKVAESYFTTKVDNSVPEVALEGQLASATGEVVGYGQPENPVENGKDRLSLPVYNLTIKAKDGDKKEDKTKRSGVKNIEVWLDGSKLSVPWSALTSCPETSCAMEKTLPIPLTGLAAGKHELEVRVPDFVGEIGKRKIEFEYFPATGMKDEYVMHYFPLPDGQGNEAEEEHPARPELAVNVMNGNLVYRERDIDVKSTAAVDLEVERYYNSMLPTSENTEWGDGWTLAQTPELKPVGDTNPAVQADLRTSSGAVEGNVALPTQAGAQSFDPASQTTVTKQSNGDYELTDETGESATSVVFDPSGRAEARLTEGYAKVDYDYEGGELDEIAVEDPGTVSVSVEELEEAEGPGPQAPTYASSFGASGSGDGQLKSPGDVAVDAQGNLWVVDRANNRIQKFSPKGQFLAKFGTFGTGDGQFNRPTAIAIAANGDLLVTDAGNTRVQRFSSSGAYLSKFGAKGTGNGQFSGAGPEGIAIDASGNIWVSDTGAGRLQKFSSAGAFVKVVGSKGSGSGQLGEPTGIAIDAGNNVWVTDWLNNRLSVFNNNGEYLSQVGSAGTGNGQFNRPDGIDIDSHGNVWVGDQNNRRVQQFDVAGQYVSQFGSAGTGPGQFEFAYPLGIATDSNGHIWVTDVGNNRLQKWTIPGQPQFYSSYLSAFGAYGSGSGQLKSPADVAVDAQGDLWVVDKGNNRVQHFNPQGQFVSQFGSTGSGDGQFNAPSAIAIGSEGNIWVTDTGNNRVQRFDSEGKFVGKFGSLGTGNGQFKEPVGIAIDPNIGWLYVVDRGNNRVQLFGKGGGYQGQAGTSGSGNLQLSEPSAIAIGGPSGGSAFTLAIADSGNNRVLRWTSVGVYVGQFGAKGTGGGQLDRPEAIDVDTQGDVWVGDRNNGRIQVFDEAGKYVDQVGTNGTGQGQFSFAAPMGIATSEGHAYVTDTANNRIQDWLGLRYTPSSEVAPTDDDPRVEVETPSGLVSSVEGEEAGDHAYAHVGDDLTAHDGPEGETKYVYDASGRMTKVTLPNTTKGEIVYFSDGRVKSVTVDPAGSPPAKTTYFEYKDADPRRTTVEPPDAPHIVYDIGSDGSVLKWWNTKEPPYLDLGGGLYDHKNEPKGLAPGDQLLQVEAIDAEGIASIQVLANGTDLVDELTCAQDHEKTGIECEKEIDQWVTNTELHAPGHLNLEAIATDSTGESASERFWVDIPPPPPPPANGTPIPPKFADIAKFREEYGLEVVFPVANEIELNERIFELIKAWHEPNTPAGQTARATMARWGVPLRPEDAAELEYREWYVEVNGPMIDQWGETNYPSTYAGYYIDHPAGGKIRVGITGNQSPVQGLQSPQGGLAAWDRVEPFPTTPTASRASLVSAETAITNAWESSEAWDSLVDIGIDDRSNRVTVGTSDVSGTQSLVNQLLGSNAPVTIFSRPESEGELFAGRYRSSGRIRAGDFIFGASGEGGKFNECTAGFGAYEDRNKKSNGDEIRVRFLLTAGHCFPLDSYPERAPEPLPAGFATSIQFGQVTRSAYNSGVWRTDAEVIKPVGTGIVPHEIFRPNEDPLPIGPAAPAEKNMRLCASGAATKTKQCGFVLRRRTIYGPHRSFMLKTYETDINQEHGDSGGPVWNPRTGASVGMVQGGIKALGITWVTPLVAMPKAPAGVAPGALRAPGMYSLNLVTAGGD
jgi:YD repeat-containing protein